MHLRIQSGLQGSKINKFTSNASQFEKKNKNKNRLIVHCLVGGYELIYESVYSGLIHTLAIMASGRWLIPYMEQGESVVELHSPKIGRIK